MGYCKVDKVVSWHPSGPWTIQFRYVDGSEYEFNALDKTIHAMWQTDNDNLTDEETLVKFSYVLGRKMRAAGYDAIMLSKATGIGQASIYRYLSGKGQPTYLNLLKISKVLHCSMGEFGHFI
jgi:hypothetical protein